MPRTPLRHLVAPVLALAASLAAAGTPPVGLADTIAASRSVLDTRQGRASGPAAAVLLRHAREAQFVLVGEEHGVAGIADTVRAIAVTLQDAGYRHFALETDRYTARILERELRAGGLRGYARWVAQADHRTAIPFYTWDAEAALAEAVVRGSDARSALWGLDQVFIGAYGTLLGEIAAQASGAAARERAAALAARATGDLNFLGKLEPRALEALRAALDAPADRALAAMVDDMMLSARIYAPFIDQPGWSPYVANRAREDLMKRQFLDYYRAAGAPKVLFKFGSNHMVRGLSATHVPSLGNFVADLALAEGRSAFNLLVLCGPGTRAGDFQGNTGNCEIDVGAAVPELAAQLDAAQPTLFDLAPWKDQPSQWKHLPAEVRDLLWAYDALLVVPNGKPARFLE